MKNSDLGPTVNTLKAEVDFLGGELTAARAEIECLRAGGCARDQGTTQYCAEAARLAAENERLREWNAEIALNAREFAAENERLRAALEWIAGTALTEAEAMAEKARAALEGRT